MLQIIWNIQIWRVFSLWILGMKQLQILFKIHLLKSIDLLYLFCYIVFLSVYYEFLGLYPGRFGNQYTGLGTQRMYRKYQEWKEEVCYYTSNLLLCIWCILIAHRVVTKTFKLPLCMLKTTPAQSCKQYQIIIYILCSFYLEIFVLFHWAKIL